MTRRRHSIRNLIPVVQFLGFVSAHYLLVLGHVPTKNQIPATFGSAGLTAMTLVMVLAARLPFIDRYLIGPGRTYRLHRRLALTAVVSVVAHWGLASPVGDGIVPALADSAAAIGKYATILMIGLVGVSFLRMIPYHLWKASHVLMGPIYLAAVYHTFFSRIPLVTQGVVWWLLVVMSAAGTAALVWTILRRFRRREVFIVSLARRIGRGIDIRLKLLDPKNVVRWKPGQFATISFDWAGSREAHPFSIASSARSGELRFVIGDLGDFTVALRRDLKVGDRVFLHEIAGTFLPDYVPDRGRRQIWVAGGFGIAPFLAAIDAMAPDDGPRIDLVYCYRSLGWAIDVEALIGHAERLPQLRVHFLGEDAAGRFDASTFETVCEPGWREADLYVCGPVPLIDVVCESWRHHRAAGAIHVELHEFRNAWGPVLAEPKPPEARVPVVDSPRGVWSFG